MARNLARERILRERGAVPKEEGDPTGSHRPVHEENFVSIWLKEDGREKEEGTVEMGNEREEERDEKRRREGEKEENETGTVERRCDGFVSVEAFENFFKGEIWRVAVIFLGKTFDVLVSQSSVVTEFCGSFSCCTGLKLVDPQSFSFSKKRAHSCAVTQEEMRFEGP